MEHAIPSSLIRDISPPRLPKRRKVSEASTTTYIIPNVNAYDKIEPTLAAVEAGRVKVKDHLAYFTEHLSKASRRTTEDVPRLSIKAFADLYERNLHDHGNHFVIHQHNHPRAGVHYDLRLQFSNGSSMSFAVPKGLPGNPNSRSLGRMAIETRVHNFWNHLIESASAKTGSLLIWDTGTYTVLPRKSTSTKPPSPQTTDNDTDVESSLPCNTFKSVRRHENEKLIEAFQTRYIRLRLHGTRLPKDYTVTIRLPDNNDFGKAPVPPLLSHNHRRRSKQPSKRTMSRDTDSEPETEASFTPTIPYNNDSADGENLDTDSEEDLETRVNNAYPGSANSIGSIHQRKWFLMLDRRSSGFKPGKSGVWERDGDGGFETFYVRGRDFERSVVTGRLARDVERDEGVEGFVGRGGWTGIET